MVLLALDQTAAAVAGGYLVVVVLAFGAPLLIARRNRSRP